MIPATGGRVFWNYYYSQSFKWCELSFPGQNDGAGCEM